MASPLARPSIGQGFDPSLRTREITELCMVSVENYFGGGDRNLSVLVRLARRERSEINFSK